MSDTTKHPASLAVRLLTEQYEKAVAAEAQKLGAIALESHGLNPSDGWRYDIPSRTFINVNTTQEASNGA